MQSLLYNDEFLYNVEDYSSLFVWFKYAFNLKHLDYTIDISDCSGSEIEETLRGISKFRLKTLNTREELSGGRSSNFRCYSPTLKKLSFYRKDSRGLLLFIKSQTDLNGTKHTTSQIEALSLHTEEPHLRSLTSDTLINPTRLKSLTLKVDTLTITADDMNSLSGYIARLKNLKVLGLEYRITAEDFERSLVDALKDKSLTHLSLSVSIDKQEYPSGIDSLLQGQKGLECLKLNLTSQHAFDKTCITSLLVMFPEMKCLRVLSLVLYSHSSSSEKWISEFQPTITNVLPRLGLLEEFSVRSNILDGDEYLLCILDSLKKLVSSLKRIKVDIGPYSSTKDDHADLIDFFRSMKFIQRLELPVLNISANSLLKKIINCLYDMKYVRVLTLGEINGSKKNPSVFVESMERILLKVGLESFSCEIDRSFRESLNDLDRDDKVDLTHVQKSNPSLEKYPRSLQLIFIGDEEEDY